MMPLESDKAKPSASSPLQRFAAPFSQSRAFPFLWLGHLISFLGSSITMVILPVLVYSLTGSSATMGIVMAVYMLPNVLMLPFAGHIVDRVDRVKIMLLADILRFLIMAATAVLALMHLLSIPLLLVLVGGYGLLDGLFQPAYAAVRASVFTPDIRIAANSLSQVTTQAARLIGPALGGLLITHWSAGFGFGIDAFTYLISMVCMLYLRKALGGRSRLGETAIRRSNHWKEDFKEGLAILRGHPWLWITILAFCFINICFTGVTSVLIPWLFKVHHGWEPYLYGLAVTFSGVGAIIAGLLLGMRSQWNHRGLIAYGGALISGLALLSLSFAKTPGAAIALFALEGFGIMLFSMIWEISLQDLVPQEAFGRVASLDMMGSFALLPVGFIVVGWTADWIGGIPTIAIFSGLGIAAILLVLCIPSIRRFQ
ncbi:MFS transporter [Paenibacillus sp. 7124]|uniref:MFS transporter n=1 Tax=Paenibacillus apii TaxID=1850370 RepID=A0A6M1PPJ4_9BACL|nr:MFS transporter [Paenibacillus apii]NGM85136.1 MFS transporter [Paenibacillus apii]